MSLQPYLVTRNLKAGWPNRMAHAILSIVAYSILNMRARLGTAFPFLLRVPIAVTRGNDFRERDSRRGSAESRGATGSHGAREWEWGRG